ncbi:MAG: Kelch repeat-containing protein [Stellaceae bacterium]
MARRGLLLAAALLLSVAGLTRTALAQGKWQFAAPMPQPMAEIVAASVGGKIYVLGGLNDKTFDADGVVWVYDPEANSWSVRKPMPAPAHHLAVSAYQGKIYVFGGFTRPKNLRAWQATDAAWQYDPATDSWKKLAPMPTPRGSAQAAEVGGRIYVIGGDRSNVPGHWNAPLVPPTAQIVVGTTEAYDPATNTWQEREPMPTPRNHFLATAVNGKIYAIDGRIGTVFVTMSDVIDLVEEYDPQKNHWIFKTRSPTNRGDISGGVYNGKIYLTGGEYQDTKRKMVFWAVETYDPATDSWGILPHIQDGRHGFAAAFVGNAFHVMGGSIQSDGMPGVDTPTASHEVFEVQ